jgi:hypothetical protein
MVRKERQENKAEGAPNKHETGAPNKHETAEVEQEHNNSEKVEAKHEGAQMQKQQQIKLYHLPT